MGNAKLLWLWMLCITFWPSLIWIGLFAVGIVKLSVLSLWSSFLRHNLCLLQSSFFGSIPWKATVSMLQSSFLHTSSLFAEQILAKYISDLLFQGTFFYTNEIIVWEQFSMAYLAITKLCFHRNEIAFRVRHCCSRQFLGPRYLCKMFSFYYWRAFFLEEIWNVQKK